MTKLLISILGLSLVQWAHAQGFRPPPFAGGVPGMSQMQGLQTARQNARTLLYREALEELRKDPKAADYAPCSPGAATDTVCAPRVDISAATVEGTPQIRKRVALLIGNNSYSEPVPKLETPITDIERIGSILRNQFGYEVTIVRNATKAATARALNQLAATVSADDSVLVFYAGHGYLLEDVKMGYWLPVDASAKTATNWISNEDISRFLAAIPARQVILVSDSCYSGTLTREFRITNSGKVDADEVLRKRSVIAFSSGGDEPVSDEGKGGHSIFAWHLINVLTSSKGLTPGNNVFTEVRRRVLKDYPQTPQYGAVVSAGHAAGGEYLFATK